MAFFYFLRHAEAPWKPGKWGYKFGHEVCERTPSANKDGKERRYSLCNQSKSVGRFISILLEEVLERFFEELVEAASPLNRQMLYLGHQLLG